MKKLLLALVFLLSSITALAVRYVVDTKDGYANLREEASSKSKILKKLKNKDEVKFWGEKSLITLRDSKLNKFFKIIEFFYPIMY